MRNLLLVRTGNSADFSRFRSTFFRSASFVACPLSSLFLDQQSRAIRMQTFCGNRILFQVAISEFLSLGGGCCSTPAVDPWSAGLIPAILVREPSGTCGTRAKSLAVTAYCSARLWTSSAFRPQFPSRMLTASTSRATRTELSMSVCTSVREYERFRSTITSAYFELVSTLTRLMNPTGRDSSENDREGVTSWLV